MRACTFLGGSEVTSRYAGGCIAIMTGSTVSTDSLMIKGTTQEGGGCMTKMTIQCGVNVTAMFADSGYSMAG